jgi:hypothetical protein
MKKFYLLPLIAVLCGASCYSQLLRDLGGSSLPNLASSRADLTSKIENPVERSAELIPVEENYPIVPYVDHFANLTSLLEGATPYEKGSPIPEGSSLVTEKIVNEDGSVTKKRSVLNTAKVDEVISDICKPFSDSRDLFFGNKLFSPSLFL